MCIKLQVISDLSNEDKECIEKVFVSIPKRVSLSSDLIINDLKKKGECEDVSIKADLGK